MLYLMGAILEYAWLEYLVHRWDMHKPGSLRFKSHTIEHHGQMGMNEAQASLTQSDVGIAFWYTLPINLGISCLVGWQFLVAWALVLFWAGFTWTSVHRWIHGEPGYWYAQVLCPWAWTVRWNHLRHHRNPRKCFGGMFWFLTDTVMFTL